MFSQGTLISDRTPVWSLLRITITLLTGILAGSFVAIPLAAYVYGIDVTYNDNPDLSMAMPLLFTQGVVSFISFIVFPIIHITALEHKPLTPLVDRRLHLTQTLLLVALLGLVFPIAISPLAEWNANLKFPEFMGSFEQWARQQEDVLAQMTDVVTSFSTIGDLLIALLVMAVFAGIGEELVFRGMIQNELWRGTNNIHLAIWTSAFVFSAIHLQFFGFVPRLLLGALFGYLYYWSGNLIVPIAAHFVNNAFGVVMRYLYNIKAISTDVEEVDSAPWSLVVICIVLAGVLLYQVRKLYLNAPGTASDKSY
ncbi:MAG TPA: CPBP family intramembrane glutamic endopeptidase [Chryseolinea sp.]|nr:CPBP family intramembrane glutamic endopeptidase [Chryseolinea sp.]